MGAILDNMETIKDICARTGVPVDTVTKRWRRASFGAFSVHFVPTPEQYAVLFGTGKQDTKDGKRINVLHSDRTPETIKDKIVGQEQEEDVDTIKAQGQEAKDKDRNFDFGRTAFRLLFGLGVLGHAFLVLWDARYLWHTGGLIAGSVVFLVILGSVVYMWRDRSGEEEENLLWFVWFLEGCAWFVHKAAIYHSGTTAYAAGIDEVGTGFLCAIVCLCAMAMSYFYFKTSNKKSEQ